jgi:thiamine pyrophosphokinase
MICYIVGAGEFHGKFTPSYDDLVIAADGGYDTLISHGYRCDVLIGDFDSISSIPESVELIKFNKRKDYTDMHLCYLEGVKRGYTEFYIFGGTGGREDHTFANLSLTAFAKNSGHNITIFSSSRKIFALKNEERTLYEESGKTLSIFAFGGDAHGVTVRGAEYECEDITLKALFPLGVSNSFVGSPITITVKDGILLVMIESR